MIVNVYVTEENGEEYRIIDHSPRSAAVKELNKTLLSDGTVPEWIVSIKFYAVPGGDIPIETYVSGESIQQNKPGRAKARNGEYERITLEVRKDLLAKIEARPKSRRALIESLLENEFSGEMENSRQNP